MNPHQRIAYEPVNPDSEVHAMDAESTRAPAWDAPSTREGGLPPFCAPQKCGRGWLNRTTLPRYRGEPSVLPSELTAIQEIHEGPDPYWSPSYSWTEADKPFVLDEGELAAPKVTRYKDSPSR